MDCFRKLRLSRAASRLAADFAATLVRAAAANQPAAMGGNKFLFTGTSGAAGWTYYVLASTNLSLPLSGWTVVATNSFDGAGNFSFTNAIVPGTPGNFMRLLWARCRLTPRCRARLRFSKRLPFATLSVPNLTCILAA